MLLNPRFLIADDHDLFRRGLIYALTDRIEGLQVIESGSFEGALEALASQGPFDLASFDLRMPGMQEGQSLAAIRRLYPKLPIAVLSGFEDRQNILNALSLGASGFIPKSLPADEIVAAMVEIMGGRIYIPPSITAFEEVDDHTRDRVAEPLEAPDHPPPVSAADIANLTPRQRDVLRQLVAGRSTKEICRDLHLAEGTVKIHLTALFRALGARNRVEAVANAIKLGFGQVSPGPR